MRTVNDMLILLRGIGFPITTKQHNQFGLLNEYSTPLLPYRIGPPTENYKLEPPIHLSTTVSLLHSYRIKEDIFSQIPSATLIRLHKLIDEDYPQPATELKRKFLLGLRWLGEATKPDATESRFVKLFFSLEGLIGGEIGNSRETKIILAKRCAFLVGKSSKEEERIYNSILRYYKIRSEIVHGTGKVILEDDFSNFGMLVRKTAWSLLEVIDHFENLIDLHNWLLGATPKVNKGLSPKTNP